MIYYCVHESRYLVPKQTEKDIQSEYRFHGDNDPVYKIYEFAAGKTRFAIYAPTDYGDESKVGMASHSNERILVAQQGSAKVGHIRYELGPTQFSFQNQSGKRETMKIKRDALYLRYIQVEPESRHKGFAKQLLHALQHAEGDRRVCGFAINDVSGKLLHQKDWQTLPHLGDEAEILLRQEHDYFDTPLSEVNAPQITPQDL